MNFTIYSKPNCQYCQKIKQVMKLTNLTHVIYTLNKDFTEEEFISEFGEGATFPQVVVDDKKLGGCSDTVKFLQEKKIV